MSTGKKFSGQGNHSSLHPTVTKFFTKHQVVLAVTKRCANHPAGQGTKSLIFRNEDYVSRRVVDSTGKETKRHPVAMLTKFRFGSEKAVVAAVSHFKDSRCRLPSSFLWHREDNRTIRGDPGAIATPQTGGDRFGFGSGCVAGHSELG